MAGRGTRKRERRVLLEINPYNPCLHISPCPPRSPNLLTRDRSNPLGLPFLPLAFPTSSSGPPKPGGHRSPSPSLHFLAQLPLCGSQASSFPGSYSTETLLPPLTCACSKGALPYRSFVGTCTCFDLWILTLHSAWESQRTGDYNFIQKSGGSPWDKGCICPGSLGTP